MNFALHSYTSLPPHASLQSPLCIHLYISQSHTPPSLNRTPLPLSIAHPSLSQSHTPPSLNRTPLPLSITHPSLSQLHTPPSLNHTPLPLSITLPSHQMRRRTALPSELAAGRERPRSEPPIPRENLVVEGKWSIGPPPYMYFTVLHPWMILRTTTKFFCHIMCVYNSIMHVVY